MQSSTKQGCQNINFGGKDEKNPCSIILTRYYLCDIYIGLYGYKLGLRTSKRALSCLLGTFLLRVIG